MSGRDGRADYSAATAHAGGFMPESPCVVDGVTFLPVSEMRTGTALTDQRDELSVHLDMIATSPIGNQLGIYARLTPDAARATAASLLRQAGIVDAHIAAQAAAAIEKARTASSSGAVGEGDAA